VRKSSPARDSDFLGAQPHEGIVQGYYTPNSLLCARLEHAKEVLLCPKFRFSEIQIFRCLSRLAKKRGIEVIFEVPCSKKLLGLWWLDSDAEYICLNKKLLHDPAKMNFVFAHELGHSILHKGRLNNARYQENCWSNDYRMEIEAEANSFAEKLISRLEELR
jgi:Zn-dependent peptidase ImmA (M78 family)